MFKDITFTKKFRNGKSSRALTNWTKEFTVAVFLQLVHAVVYSVLVEGMLSTFTEEDGVLRGNILLYVFCVTFLFKAEAITKSIFNVKSPGNAIGDTIAAAATFGVVAQKTKQILGGGKPSDRDKEDKADANAHAANVKQMESNAAQKNKEEANKKDEKSGGDEYTPKHSSGKESSSDPDYKPKHGGKAPEEPAEGAPEPTIEANGKDNKSDQLKELERANEVLAHLASKKKTKGVPKKIIQGAISGTIRTAAVTTGAIAGLATGDMQKVATYAATANEVGKRVGKGAKNISGAAIDRMGGAVMRVKAQNGGYKKQLKKAGVDVDKLYGDAKAKAILKAQGQFVSAQRRGGDALGNYKMARAISTKLTEKETRDQKTK